MPLVPCSSHTLWCAANGRFFVMKTKLIFDFYNTLYSPKTGKFFRGMSTLLNKLTTQYKLILITTSNPRREEQIRRLKLSRYFSPVILCPKKSLSLFRNYVDLTTIIIGDRQEEEINIASKLKLQSIKVNPLLENPVKTIRQQLSPGGLK